MQQSSHSPAVKPELLAPAGDWAMMHAAVLNGADAVYFGLEDFNARRRAENFTLAQLGEVMDYLHDHNVRGYVAFNTLVFPDELGRARQFAAGIAAAGADAAIVQDLGLIRLIHQAAPTLPLHASTQATQTHAAGIAMLAELGVSRVILARELSLKQIALARAAGLEVETFGHGALCISYSGQCLASEYLWGRSANRGQCGQACRLPYRLLCDGQPLGEKRYPLSPQDLCTYDLLGQLAGLGVSALKIEGRLKGPHYVAAVVQLYRAAIDAAVAGEPFRPTADHRAQLAATFSRGYTHGFMDGFAGADLVAGEFPASRGVLIGTVVTIDRQAVIVSLADDVETTRIRPGDGLAFGDDDDSAQGGRVYEAAPAQDRYSWGGDESNRRRLLRLGFGSGDIDFGHLQAGQRVWKTDDPQVQKQLEASWTRDVVMHPRALDFELTAAVGGPVTLIARDQAGRPAQAQWAGPAQAATKHPLSATTAAEQLGRLGGTPFALGRVRLMTSPGQPPQDTLEALVPKSILNDLRRQVVEQMQQQARQGARHAITTTDALAALRGEEVIGEVSDAGVSPTSESVVDVSPASESGAGVSPACLEGVSPSVQHEDHGQDAHATPILHVLARTPEQVHALLAAEASPDAAIGMIYLDMSDRSDLKQSAAACRAAGRAFAPATPRILKGGEEPLLDTLLALEPTAVLVRNLASLALLRQRRPQLTLLGDYSLNVANDLTAGWLAEKGLARVVPSYDLNLLQLQSLCGHMDVSLLEIVLHQHLPMLHMQHCLARADGACPNNEPAAEATGRKDGETRTEGETPSPRATGRDCPTTGHIELEDRNGERHPVVRDLLCRNTVYGSYVQSGVPFYSVLRGLGLQHMRVELLHEAPDDAVQIVRLHADLLAGHTSDQEAWAAVKARGTVTRGTWAHE